jgi:hypothetical protein
MLIPYLFRYVLILKTSPLHAVFCPKIGGSELVDRDLQVNIR